MEKFHSRVLLRQSKRMSRPSFLSTVGNDVAAAWPVTLYDLLDKLAVSLQGFSGGLGFMEGREVHN